MIVMLSASTAMSYTTIYVTQVIESLMCYEETWEEVVDRVKKSIMRNNEPYKVDFEMVTSITTEDGNRAKILISYYIIRF